MVRPKGSKDGHMKGKEYLQYKSTQNWIQSLRESAVSRGKSFTENALRSRLKAMHDYVREFHGDSVTPDELLQLAREDIRDAMTRLTNFFSWLQGKTVEGVKLRKTKMSWNGATTIQAYVRGFYTHNDLRFPKRFKTPKRRVSAVSKRDAKVEIYGYDEEKDEIIYRNGTLQHFLSNLSFRDQTIGLCLLSTGADATDVLKLNVGFVKDARGQTSKAKRFLWHDNRKKDGIEFKVFLSEEATQFLKRYVEQERADAEDDEPLFVKEDGGRLNAHALAMNFRVAAEKMGYVKPKESNPFRPKRFRHLFRTACGNAHIDPGFTMAFMGHASDISATYLEKSDGLFLKEYVKAEPFLTVFGVEKTGMQELTEEVQRLTELVTKREEEIKALEREVKEFYYGIGRENKALRERQRILEENMNRWAEETKDIFEEELTKFIKETSPQDFKKAKAELEKGKS